MPLRWERRCRLLYTAKAHFPREHSPEAMKFRASGIATQSLANAFSSIDKSKRASLGRAPYAPSRTLAVSDPSVCDL